MTNSAPPIDYAPPPNNSRDRDNVIITFTILIAILCAAVWAIPFISLLLGFIPFLGTAIDVVVPYGVPWLSVVLAIRFLRSRRAALRLPLTVFLATLLATLASYFLVSYIYFGKFITFPILPALLYQGSLHLLGLLPCQFLAYKKTETNPPPPIPDDPPIFPLTKRSKLIAIGVLLLAVVGLATFMARATRGPEAITWDFRKGEGLESVGWPASVTGDIYERDGSFNLTFIGDDGIKYTDHVSSFICDRKGKTVTGMSLSFDTEDLDHACHHAREIMTTFKYEKRCFDALDKWEEKAKGGSWDVFETISRGELRITPVGNNEYAMGLSFGG